MCWNFVDFDRFAGNLGLNVLHSYSQRYMLANPIDWWMSNTLGKNWSSSDPRNLLCPSIDIPVSHYVLITSSTIFSKIRLLNGGYMYQWAVYQYFIHTSSISSVTKLRLTTLGAVLSNSHVRSRAHIKCYLPITLGHLLSFPQNPSNFQTQNFLHIKLIIPQFTQQLATSLPSWPPSTLPSATAGTHLPRKGLRVDNIIHRPLLPLLTKTSTTTFATTSASS